MFDESPPHLASSRPSQFSPERNAAMGSSAITAECLALVADTSLSGRRVARELDRLVRLYGKPAAVVSYRTKLTSRAVLEWQNSTGVS